MGRYSRMSEEQGTEEKQRGREIGGDRIITSQEGMKRLDTAMNEAERNFDILTFHDTQDFDMIIFLELYIL